MTAVVGTQPDDRLRVMTEAELALMRVADGATVAERDGRYWFGIFPGFFQPVHLLARVRVDDVHRPALGCWGYRAALPGEDAHRANGSVPVHLIGDPQAYDARRISPDQRRNERRCRRQVELVTSRDPSLLESQGYPVFRSAQDRLHYWKEQSESDFRRTIAARVDDDRRLFVVGLIDGRVRGYMESFAVDGILYLDELIVATEAMSTGISTGLYLETIEVAKRAGTVREVCLGLDTPERPGLTRFKEGLCAPVVQVPAHVAIPRAVGAFIRARRPAVYYRLTGLKPTPGNPASTT